MRIRPLAVRDAYEMTPKLFTDPRGTFLEWYRHEQWSTTLGYPLRLAQANCSVSKSGALRGIHFADVPPGQAKYVTCVAGDVLDVVVDLRVGSPSFGEWDAVRLNDRERRAIYLAEGLGHAFFAISSHATVIYLCSETYNREHEREVNPLDPALGIDWPAGIEPLVSPKDAKAPTLAEAEAAGILPNYEECRAYYELLRTRGNA